VGTDCLAQNKKGASFALTYNLITQFFVETFVGMIVGYFLGKYLDKWLFDEKQIFTYLLMILGMLSGLANLIRRAMKTIDGGDQHETKDEHH